MVIELIIDMKFKFSRLNFFKVLFKAFFVQGGGSELGNSSKIKKKTVLYFKIF
jgi:hypothetical protein